MKNLSVKGIARQFGEHTGNFWIRQDWLIEEEISLKAQLEQIARSERSIEVQNCPSVTTDLLNTASNSAVGALIGTLIGGLLFGPLGASLGRKLGFLVGGVRGYYEGILVRWDAKFQQTWTHILVKIKVFWLADSSDEVLEHWKNEIEFGWSNRRVCWREGELPCPITFEIQWLKPDDDEKSHIALIVTDEMDRAAFFWWDDRHGAWPAVHEFGHIIGLADEYPETGYPCPGRDNSSDPGIDTNSIMGMGSSHDWVPNTVPHGTALTVRDSSANWRTYLTANTNTLFQDRHFTHFSDHIGSDLA